MSLFSFEFTIESRLAAPADMVWVQAKTMEWVNQELGPWVRMTVPARARGVPIDRAPIDQVAFISILLAFGVIPFDLHWLKIHELKPTGFAERSPTLLNKCWGHTRDIEALPNGCVLRDRLQVDLRMPFAPLVRPVAFAIFGWRHRQLVNRFGQLSG